MRRYWWEAPAGEAAEFQSQQEILLQGELFHHVFVVCRQDKGSRFELLTPSHFAYLVEVQEVGKKSARVRVISQREVPRLQPPFVSIVLAVPRFPVLESVLERAVEMGVHSLQLAFSDQSFVGSRDKISPQRWERWQKIITSACQQSGRTDRLQLLPPEKLRDLKHGLGPSEIGIFAFESTELDSIRLHQVFAKGPQRPENVWIYVGAEGGFSQEEAMWFRQNGLQPVSLGEQVLRVETAVLSLVAVARHELSRCLD